VSSRSFENVPKISTCENKHSNISFADFKICSETVFGNHVRPKTTSKIKSNEPGSSVGIAAGYGQDGPGIESHWGGG
jgi:hypothetical protein